MNIWQYLDARADRQQKRKRDLLDAGLDTRSLLRLAFDSLDARIFIAFAIIGLFGFAFFRNPQDEVIVGALIGGFAGAWGFYLGNSRRAEDEAARGDMQQATLNKALDKLPSDPQASVEIPVEPGESVTVAGKPSQP